MSSSLGQVGVHDYDPEQKDVNGDCHVMFSKKFLLFTEQRDAFLLRSLLHDSGELDLDMVGENAQMIYNKLGKISSCYPINSSGDVADVFQELVECDQTKLQELHLVRGEC